VIPNVPPEYMQLAIAILGVACTALGWFARVLWDAVTKLRRDLSVLEVHVAQHYVPYDRLQDALRPLTDSIEKLRDAVHTKADR
jgi:hypothetical protein